MAYVRNPDGSYSITLPDGRSVVATGPEAERYVRTRSAAPAAPAPVANPPPEPRPRLAFGDLPFAQYAEAGPPQIAPEARAGFAGAGVLPPAPPVEEPPPVRYGEADHFYEGPPPQAPPPGPSGYVVIPGGEQLAGRTTQHGPGLTAAQQEQIIDLEIDRRVATQEAADAERAAQAEQARVAGLGHQAYEEEGERLRAAEAERLARESTALEASREASEATGDYAINPSRYWSNLNGWQKGVALIGGMIGGLFASRSRDGRNLFGERLDRLVAEDIATQQEELAALERAALARRDHLAATQIANDRERLSEGDAFTHRLRTLSAMAQQVEAESQDPIMAARAREADIAIQERLSDRLIGEDQAVRGTETRQYAHVPTQVVGLGGGAPTQGDDVYSEKELDKWTHTFSKDIAKTSEAEAKMEEVRGMLRRHPDSIPGIGLVKERVGQNPVAARALLTEQGRINQGTVERFVLAYQHAVSGSQVSDAEMVRITNAMRGARTRAELAAAVREAEQSLSRARRGYEAGVPRAAVDRYYERGGYRPSGNHATMRRGAE